MEMRSLHGDVVRDDSLLLQLKLLERVGLEDLFRNCSAGKLAVDQERGGGAVAYGCCST
jgi:hypothetical protein